MHQLVFPLLKIEYKKLLGSFEAYIYILLDNNRIFFYTSLALCLTSNSRSILQGNPINPGGFLSGLCKAPGGFSLELLYRETPLRTEPLTTIFSAHMTYHLLDFFSYSNKEP